MTINGVTNTAGGRCATGATSPASGGPGPGGTATTETAEGTRNCCKTD